MSGIVSMSSAALCRYLQQRGWKRVDGKGDHEIYLTPGNKKVHIPRGGHWNKCVPRAALKQIAGELGMHPNKLKEAV